MWTYTKKRREGFVLSMVSGIHWRSWKVCPVDMGDIFLIYMQYIYTVSPTCESEKAKGQLPQSCLTVCDPMNYMYSPWHSPGQNTGVGSLYFLQGIFPTQGSNPGLLHCRWILYQLSCQGSSIHLQCINIIYMVYCQYSMVYF